MLFIALTCSLLFFQDWPSHIYSLCTATENSSSKHGDISCHCEELLGKEVEGVVKCSAYSVLTCLSACHQQNTLFCVNSSSR